MAFKIFLTVDPDLEPPPGGCAGALRMRVREVLRMIQAPGIVPIVSLLACSDRAMRRLNRRWLGKDRPTNVISFQSPEMSAAVKRLGPVPLRSGALGKHFAGRRGELFIGDVAVGIERASEEAERGGLAVRGRISALVVHGLMHILGYTHRTMPEIIT